MGGGEAEGERKPRHEDVCTKAWGWNDSNMLMYLVTNGCLSSSLWKNKPTKCVLIFSILFELILWGRKMVVTVKGDYQDNRASAVQERVAKGATQPAGWALVLEHTGPGLPLQPRKQAKAIHTNNESRSFWSHNLQLFLFSCFRHFKEKFQCFRKRKALTGQVCLFEAQCTWKWF